MATVEELLQSLMNEVQELKQQNVELKAQLADVKDDVSEVKEDVAEVKETQVKTNEKLDIIGAFQAAVQAGQPFEKSMHDLENVTKNLTGTKDTDKVTFFAKDSDSRFFTTDGEKRTFDNTVTYNNAIQRAMENGEISIENNTTAYIPMMSQSGQAIGIIVAEKADGFEGIDFTKFAKDSQVMNIMSQAFDKKIADDKAELDISGAKNEVALDKYIKRELVHSLNEHKPITMMRISVAGIQPDIQENISKELAKAIEKNGRTSLQDNVFRMNNDTENITFVTILNCTEQRAYQNEDFLKMAVEKTIGSDNFSIDIHQMESVDIDPYNAVHVFENEFSKLDKSDEIDFSVDLNGNKFTLNEENAVLNTDVRTAHDISQKLEKNGIEHSVHYEGEHSAVTLYGEKGKCFAETVNGEQAKRPLSDFLQDTLTPYFDKVMSIANDIISKDEQQQQQSVGYSL